jgi:hypothetical protein
LSGEDYELIILTGNETMCAHKIERTLTDREWAVCFTKMAEYESRLMEICSEVIAEII